MRHLLLGACCVLLLCGCSDTLESDRSALGHVTEKPGTLSPDRTALRVAQQYAPDGVSNEVRLLLLFNALVKRNRTPSTTWDVQPKGALFEVKATLTARDRPDTVFAWTVDLSKPAATVCQPESAPAKMLSNVKVQLDESNIEEFLGPVVEKSATPTPAPATP